MASDKPRWIDWRSAQIEDGTLTVELTGSPSKPWKARFEGVVAMLDTPHSGWDRVRLTKHGLEIRGVQRGDESALRHFLESVLLQVNAETDPDTPPQEQLEHGQEPPGADEEMAATFRGFAGERERT